MVISVYRGFVEVVGHRVVGTVSNEAHIGDIDEVVMMVVYNFD